MVTATDRHPRFSVRVTHDDITQDLNVVLCDGRGDPDPLQFRVSQYPRSSLKMSTGGTKHSDYEPPYRSIEQRDWSGGLGQLSLDSNGTSFLDSYRMDTWHDGRALAGPMEFYTVGTSGKKATEHAYSSGATYKLGPLDNTSSTSYKVAVKISPTETFDPTLCEYWYGMYDPLHSSATIKVRVDVVNDNSGDPGSTVYFSSGGPPPYSTYSTLRAGGGKLSRTMYDMGLGSLNSGTDYWLVWAFSYTGDWANDDEVGPFIISDNGASHDVKHYDTANGWREVAGSTGVVPFFRLSELSAQPHRSMFFEHLGCLYTCWTYQDGTAPKIFKIGYTGTATDGSTTTLVDSTKTFTVDDLIGSYVVFRNGVGSSLEQPWARITDNDATTITFDAIDIAIDRTTRYSIVKYDTAVEVTGHGMTGQITDVHTHNDIVYFMRGDNEDIFHMYDDTFTKEDGNRGSFMTTAQDSNGRTKIWLATASFPPVIYKASPTFADTGITPLNLSFGNESMGSVDVTDWDMELDNLDNWASEGSPTSKTKDTGQKYEGSRSLKLETTVNDTGFSTTPATVNNAIYRIQFAVLTSSTADAGWHLEFGGATIYTDGVPTSNYWTIITAYGTATGLTTKLAWLADCTGGDTSRWYVDNVRIDKISNLNNVAYDERITSLVAYGDKRRCHALTTGGIYREDQGDFYDISPEQYFSTRDERNGRVSLVHGKYMFLSFADGGFERFFEGQLDDIGPNRGDSISTLRWDITDAVSYGDWIIVAMSSSVGSRILLYNGFGWHEVYSTDAGDGRTITNLYVQPMPWSLTDRLWFSEGEDTVYLGFALRPYNNSSYVYALAAFYDSSRYHAGAVELDKYIGEINVVVSNYYGEAMAYYGNTALWSGIFHSYFSGPFEVGVSSGTLSVTDSKFQVRVAVFPQYPSGTAMTLDAVVVDMLENIPAKFQYQMQVLLEDESRSLPGNSEHRRVEDMIADLEIMLNTPKPSTIYTPYSTVYNKKVKITSLDWVPLVVSDEGQLEQVVASITMVDV